MKSLFISFSTTILLISFAAKASAFDCNRSLASIIDEGSISDYRAQLQQGYFSGLSSECKANTRLFLSEFGFSNKQEVNKSLNFLRYIYLNDRSQAGFFKEMLISLKEKVRRSSAYDKETSLRYIDKELSTHNFSSNSRSPKRSLSNKQSINQATTNVRYIKDKIEQFERNINIYDKYNGNEINRYISLLADLYVKDKSQYGYVVGKLQNLKNEMQYSNSYSKNVILNKVDLTLSLLEPEKERDDYKSYMWGKSRKNNYTSNAAVVYQHCNYDGYSVSLEPGYYKLYQLRELGVKNDDLSSVKVPAGLTVTLYEHDNFGGRSWLLNSNESCLVRRGANDQVSSIVVK
ncbi:hypothetical protein [Spartinivicinus poritis]|uniref:Beta/gamma crystallin 'Greek key' domain-containing protein n=1 Tax=Spartinivicinus poritis TaxID=2994640 RepID=A0ABT5U7Q4_9GAMM|nr:hypothetical protein [Spartinivicinus sp. A2-2]MDE1462401.1 hypothetical protein [Spartinivicinus sp. A2-2]